MNTNPTCLFNGCVEPARRDNKCRQHRLRAVCSVDHCHNQTYARKLCVKHGGKKQCQVDGCVSNARSHGFCCKHGAESVKKVCYFKDCSKYARARGRCVSHGGGRACYVESCDLLARDGELCHRHRDLPSVCLSVVETIAGDASHSELPSFSQENEMDWLVHDLKFELEAWMAPIDHVDSWPNLIDNGANGDGGAFTTDDEQQILELLISL